MILIDFYSELLITPKTEKHTRDGDSSQAQKLNRLLYVVYGIPWKYNFCISYNSHYAFFF